MTCRAPTDVPEAASSPGAPAARSGTPSPSRSPTAASEEPSLSPLASEGPLDVVPSTAAARFTVPSELRNTKWTAPLEIPPPPLNIEPEARSGVPSPSRSPMPATDDPNSLPLASEGPFGVDELISAVLFTVPSRFISSRWTAPRLPPPSSSPGAPAARSGTPSPSMSPTPATDAPKLSLPASEGPLAVDPSSSTVSFTVPSRFMNDRWTAPTSPLPPGTWEAPTARSAMPSPSTSPAEAAAFPRPSPADTAKPPVMPPITLVTEAGHALSRARTGGTRPKESESLAAGVSATATCDR